MNMICAIWFFPWSLPPLSMFLRPENIITHGEISGKMLCGTTPCSTIFSNLSCEEQQANRQPKSASEWSNPLAFRPRNNLPEMEGEGKPPPTVPESTRNDTCKLPTRIDCEGYRTTHQIGLRKQLVLTFHSSLGRAGTARRRRRRGRHRPPPPPPVRHDRRLQRPSQPDTSTTRRKLVVIPDSLARIWGR
jgi:hypothetical protein